MTNTITIDIDEAAAATNFMERETADNKRNLVIASLRRKLVRGYTSSIQHNVADQLKRQRPETKPAEPTEFGAKITATVGTKRARFLRARSDSGAYAWKSECGGWHRYETLTDVNIGWEPRPCFARASRKCGSMTCSLCYPTAAYTEVVTTSL